MSANHTPADLSSGLPAWRQPLDHTLFIEASAGTGKTWTLAMLYLRLVIEHGLAPARILVVTFTEAATAELRSRLRQRLAQALARVEAGLLTEPADPALEELLVHHGHARAAERLREALETFDGAAVHTLHGFCARVLGESAFRLGLPRIRDWGEDPPEWLETLLADRLRILLESLHPVAAAGFTPRTPGDWLTLLAPALEHDRQRLEGPEPPVTVERLNHLAQAAEQAWLELRRLPPVVDETAWQAWIQALLSHPGRDNRKVQERWYRNWFRRLRALLDSPDLPPRALFVKGMGDLSAGKVAERWHKAPFQPDELLAGLWSLQAELEELEACLTAFRGGTAVRWLTELPAELAADRLARGRLAFSDLLRLVRDALEGPLGPELARELQQRYPATLVDEFQDTDPVQWRILQALAAPGNRLALVGDPKQAIYGFRGGDVYAYLKARDGAPAPGGLPVLSCRLDTCQRSDAPLVVALNTVFQRPFRAFRVEGIPLEAVKHRAGPRLRSRGGEPLPALELVLPPEDLWTVPAGQLRDFCEAFCVSQVRTLLSDGRQLQQGDTWRELRGGDLAILTLNHRQAARIHGALLAAGIPAQRISQESVWSTAEARGLRLLLEALLAPGDPARLLTALAGGLCDLDGAALEHWHTNPEGLARVAAVFGRAGHLWHERGIAPALAACLDGLEVPGALLAHPDGARRLTNVRHLQELLLALETEGGLGPGELLAAYDRQLRRPDTGSEQALLRLESDESLVQVVTVHASKGLEYPLVLAPYLWDETLADPGLLPACHDEQGRRVLDAGSPAFELRHRAAREETLAERVRLCYVAMTRARHSLQLVCAPPGQAAGSRLALSGLGALLLGSADRLDSLEELAQRLARRPRKDAPPPPSRADWLARLEGLCATANGLHPGAAAVIQPPAEVPTAIVAAPDPGAPPRALPLPRGLERRITVGSFTGLTAQRAQDTESEQGAEQAVRLAENTADDSGPGDMEVEHDPDTPAPGAGLQVPPGQGAALGIALHAAFEQRLGRPGMDEPELEHTCRQVLGQAGVSPELAPALAACVTTTLASPLPGLDAGFRLGQLQPERAVQELEFLLPLDTANPLTARSLRQALETHAWPPGPEGARWRAGLEFHSLAGYLKGFIDLVFQADGRWHILDWKSNRLGPLASDYGPAALERAMAHSDYYLQGLLYSVALYRLLCRRVPGFDPGSQLGGLYYLFVRGIDGMGVRGIWHTPLPVALLEELDRAWAPPVTHPAGRPPDPEDAP